MSAKTLVLIQAALASITAAVFLLGAETRPAYGATFTVNSAADPGDGTCEPGECTLREAIDAANNSEGPDRIEFDIDQGPQTISPTSALPEITDRVTIDGTTQRCQFYPCIEISGQNAGSGAAGISIVSGGGNSTVRSVIINRFDSAGISISWSNAGNNTIEGNFLGTAADGGSSPGAQGNGIWLVNSSTNTIRDNLISGNNYGINLNTTHDNVIQGNLIGTDLSGAVAVGNTYDGIVSGMYGVDNNTIGGLSPAGRNIISGNGGSGIHLGGGTAGNVIQGNYIGIDGGGAAALPNADSGVFIDPQSGTSTGNKIGGTVPGARNVISGNGRPGVMIVGGASANLIQGNYIGTDATGGAAIGNVWNGIRLVDSPSNTIGGGEPGARNVISGNPGNGISLYNRADYNGIQGNYIGTNASGTGALPNHGSGIYMASTIGNVIGAAGAGGNVISGNTGNGVNLSSAHGTVIQNNIIGRAATGDAALGNMQYGIMVETIGPTDIGGTGPGQGNIIAHNGMDGVVLISFAAQAGILGNSMFANKGLGIDLLYNGVTPNDPMDADSGPNNLQNFPVLSGAESDGQFTYVDSVSLNSTPNMSFRIEFFKSETCDPSGYGEGTNFMGWAQASTDGGGNISFGTSLDFPTADGWFLTATATDPDNNTSEFSACAQVTALPPTPTPTPSASQSPAASPTPTPTPAASPTPALTATPQAGTPGDVDCDGDVDGVDALLVLRDAAGLAHSAGCISAGDIDCDGERKAPDVLLILRHVAGLPAELTDCRALAP